MKGLISVNPASCIIPYKEKHWIPSRGISNSVVKTLESPLDSKVIKPVNSKGNQSWIFIGRTCWTWSFNNLDIWCNEPTHWKRPQCWERSRAVEGGDKRWDGYIASLTMDMNLSKLQEIVKGRGAWRASVHEVARSQIWLSDWTTTNTKKSAKILNLGYLVFFN